MSSWLARLSTDCYMLYNGILQLNVKTVAVKLDIYVHRILITNALKIGLKHIYYQSKVFTAAKGGYFDESKIKDQCSW